MRKAILIVASALFAMTAVADEVTPTYTEWQDQEVNEVNRFPVHATFFAYETKSKALQGEMERSANYLSLEGPWKFKYVENADQRPTDFYKTDLNDTQWKTLAIPGIWEMYSSDIGSSSPYQRKLNFISIFCSLKISKFFYFYPCIP